MHIITHDVFSIDSHGLRYDEIADRGPQSAIVKPLVVLMLWPEVFVPFIDLRCGKERFQSEVLMKYLENS